MYYLVVTDKDMNISFCQIKELLKNGKYIYKTLSRKFVDRNIAFIFGMAAMPFPCNVILVIQGYNASEGKKKKSLILYIFKKYITTQ